MKWLGVFLFFHCWLLCPPPPPSIFSVFPGRRSARVKCLSLELNTLIWPGLERGPFDPESTFFHHPTYHGLQSSFRTIQQMWYLVNSMSEKYSRFLLEYRSLTLRNLNNHGFKLICNVQFNFSLLKGSCIFFSRTGRSCFTRSQKRSEVHCHFVPCSCACVLRLIGWYDLLMTLMC